MKYIFSLFVVLLLIQTNVFAQTNKRILGNTKNVLHEIQEVKSIDLPTFEPVPTARSGNSVKSPLFLNGIYEIGVGKTYEKLSTAVNDLVSQGVSGPVTFEFTDANYTDTSIVINAFAGQGAANPVVFQLKSGNPSAKIFFTGGITTRTWGIRFDSTEYVSFIGSTTVGEYPITFEVDTTIGNPTRNAFQVIRSNNIRLEGLTLIGHKRWSDATAATILNQTSFVGSTAKNSYNTYTNLLLKRGSIGVSTVGISTAIRDDYITISNCDFGGDDLTETFTNRGIQILSVDNLTIYKNNIRRGKNFSTATFGPAGIISFGGNNNLVISHNQIHDLEKYGTTAGNVSGIRFQTNGPGVYTNTKIFNNMIYDLRNTTGINASAVQAVEGIAISSSSPNSFNVVEVYNNTVHLTGPLSNTTPSYTANILISSALAADTVKAFNNILSNETYNTGSGAYPYADFQNNPTVSGKLKSDHNLFWYPTADGFLSIFAGDNLDQWQSNTSQDVNSIEQSDPFFVSAKLVGPDPHITPGSLSAAESNAIPKDYVTDDIDGNSRDGSTPDIGADEFSGTRYSLALYLLIQGLFDGSNMIPDTVKVYLRNTTSPYAIVDSSKGVLDDVGYGMFQFNSWTPGNSYYISVTHRNAVETWSKNGGKAFNLYANSYEFRFDSSKAYSDGVSANLPMKKVSGVWCFWSGEVTNNYFIEYDDLLQVYNFYLLALEDPGYYPEDITGNEYVEYDDVLLVYNNYSAEIWSQNPLNEVLTARPIKVKEINNRINTQE